MFTDILFIRIKNHRAEDHGTRCLLYPSGSNGAEPLDRFADLCITEQERLKAPHLSTISVMIVTVPLLSVKVPVEIELEYHVRSRSPIFRVFPPPLSFSLPFPSMLGNNNLETPIARTYCSDSMIYITNR